MKAIYFIDSRGRVSTPIDVPMERYSKGMVVFESNINRLLRQIQAISHRNWGVDEID